jgi:choline monooxygenase
MIPPSHYSSVEHYSLEQEAIFRKSWIFVGMSFELDGLVHQGVRVGDVSLVLQKDKSNRPRAFLNACSHRHTRLCEAGSQKGAIRCPYHGWTYDREGIPRGIPQKEAFPQVIRAPEDFRLSEFPCDVAGQFVFVRLASDGQSLPEYLGNQYQFLVHASAGMTEVLDQFSKSVAANWKVIIENALEGYHVPAVHSRTFMEADGMDSSSDSPQFFFNCGRHSYLEHRANPDWVVRFDRLSKKVGQWPWRFEHYTHHHIFPNLTITSFMGYSFHIQVFEPIGPQSTLVHSRTVGVEFADSTEVGKKMMQRIYQDGHEFTRRVFDEDAGICTKVQEGLRDSRRIAVLGEGIEDRVKHFQSAYLASTV